MGRITGRPLLRSGLRQLALGGIAAAVTYGVGALVGAQATKRMYSSSSEQRDSR